MIKSVRMRALSSSAVSQQGRGPHGHKVWLDNCQARAADRSQMYSWTAAPHIVCPSLGSPQSWNSRVRCTPRFFGKCYMPRLKLYSGPPNPFLLPNYNITHHSRSPGDRGQLDLASPGGLASCREGAHRQPWPLVKACCGITIHSLTRAELLFPIAEGTWVY